MNSFLLRIPRLLALMLSLSFFASVCVGQVDRGIDSFKGLELGAATVNDVIARFGEPKSDKSAQKYSPLKLKDWFDVEEKNFRVLLFEGKNGIEGFNEVKFGFRDDKLVAVRLKPKKLIIRELFNLFRADFQYISRKNEKSFRDGTPNESWERDRPEKFPDLYYVAQRSPHNFAFAMISHDTVRALTVFRNGELDPWFIGSPDDEVKLVEVISRSLLK
ncbi:MAG TPA: hypothetical protein VMM38_13305 [Aridibacter sp.]|nr:hypothetical protein [Aridibacter sp.]